MHHVSWKKENMLSWNMMGSDMSRRLGSHISYQDLTNWDFYTNGPVEHRPFGSALWEIITSIVVISSVIILDKYL